MIRIIITGEAREMALLNYKIPFIERQPDDTTPGLGRVFVMIRVCNRAKPDFSFPAQKEGRLYYFIDSAG